FPKSSEAAHLWSCPSSDSSGSLLIGAERSGAKWVYIDGSTGHIRRGPTCKSFIASIAIQVSGWANDTSRLVSDIASSVPFNHFPVVVTDDGALLPIMRVVTAGPWRWVADPASRVADDTGLFLDDGSAE